MLEIKVKIVGDKAVMGPQNLSGTVVTENLKGWRNRKPSPYCEPLLAQLMLEVSCELTCYNLIHQIFVLI